MPEDWWYFPVVARLHNERTGYPTQKPMALLERMILASSNPGDMIADFFCGSGTTAVAAEGLGRNYIACDVTWRAIHTTRTRLVAQAAAPFTLEYEEKSHFFIPRRRSSDIQAHLSSADPPCIILAQPDQKVLDYWEVDPAWDGKIFRSALQVYHPKKKQSIPKAITSPLLKNSSVCIRYVTIDGKVGQDILAREKPYSR